MQTLNSLPTLISRIETSEMQHSGVIHWGCPVPVFGNLERATVATLGINPSNLEFVDSKGKELEGGSRRFHTLNSLELPSWRSADSTHLRVILESFNEYFSRNPYDRWFRRLDTILAGANASFYNRHENTLQIVATSHFACHLDLVPYATKQKWTELSVRQRESLLRVGGNCLGQLLRDSAIDFIVCNGRSVVQQFELVTGLTLSSSELRGCELPRQSGPDVKGIVYEGAVGRICGVDLERDVTVLGFNHNLQSSFGVTNNVLKVLAAWIEKKIGESKK